MPESVCITLTQNISVYIFIRIQRQRQIEMDHIFSGGETVCRFAVRRRLYADNTTQHLTRAIIANTIRSLGQSFSTLTNILCAILTRTLGKRDNIIYAMWRH